MLAVIPEIVHHQSWIGWGFWAVTLLVQIVGIFYAVYAIMISRTPQAAIGWSLALVVFPFLAIPLFLVFGESKFSGYINAGTGKVPDLDRALEETAAALEPYQSSFPEKYLDAERLAGNLRKLPMTGGNRVKLLVDGKETFDAIFAAIDRATEYVIVQFYVVHNDHLGNELKARLLAATRRGARCWLLYDSVGAKHVPASFLEELLAGGVSVQSFVTNRHFGRRFQINFRNHRKLVIVDGKEAYIGGLNAGDEYMGLGPLGPWRDTHMRIEGPAVQALQVSFQEDWYYVSRTVPKLPIKPEIRGDQVVLPFASGPTQPWNIVPAMYCEIIHDVRKRLWIASPYFVPDPSLRTALGHAALRGVDVRLILPKGIDHLFPWLSSFTQYPHMEEAGVKIYRYQPGFMHQKVLLADDDLAIVGSVNLDYRSFMLNFELAAAVHDGEFAKEVERMFEADFARSEQEELSKFARSNFFFRFKCRLAALMSPEQ